MSDNKPVNYENHNLGIPQIVLILCVVWVVVIGGFLWLEIKHHKKTLYELATSEARASFNKDLLYRRWAAGHGGIYVPITKETPPNPYLSHVDERDISTPSGKALTLVNPAYMTRQVHELNIKQYGTRGHITSLNPLRPGNQPDKWEIDALEAFKRGEDEIRSFTLIDQNEYLRFMGPLITEKRCLKCHAEKGLKEGDLLGGISVSIPLKPYKSIVDEITKDAIFEHLIVFTVGLMGLVFGGLMLHKRESDRFTVLKALHASEERHGKIIQTAMDGFWLADLQGRFKKVNDAYCRMSGYSEKELLGMSISDLEASETPKEIAANIEKIIAQGEDRFERKHRRKDGSIFDVELSIQYQADEGGNFVCFLRDISASKRDAEKLHNSEEKFSKIFHSSPDVITITSLETGQIIELNKSFERIFGYNREEALGRTTIELALWPNPEDRKRMMKVVKESGLIRDMEVEVCKKSGETVFCLVSGELIEIQDQVFMVAVSQDITEKKKAADEKEKLEAQLIQARKMESIGTLAGGIAHDFNNILTPIMVHSEMMMTEIPDESPLQQNTRQVYEAGKRARDLVKQILTFARIREKKRIPLKASLVIKEAVKFMRSTIPSTIDIMYDFETEQDTVLADPTQLNQIVMNLCTNASHAMRDKGGILEIILVDEYIGPNEEKLFNGLNAGHYLRLSIKDTGTGIPSDCIDKIFEPYFTTKSIHEGTGMGLSMVHGIVISYGGGIKVESEPGKGTTFHVLLPIIEEEASPVLKPMDRLPKGDERILLVDDEKAAIDAVQPMLESLGYKVTGRTSSIEALEAFRYKPEAFDLVITDQTMPNMTGRELAEALTSIRPGIPIILCTGFSEQIDEREAGEIGICVIVMKPIVTQEMAKRIREVLD